MQTRGVEIVSHVVLLVVQSAHVAPPDPQRVSRKPAKHVPLWQQPTHVFGLHAVAHVPPLHDKPFNVQSVQARPPRPHCVSVSLVTHVLPAQQPFLQFCGVQSGGVFVHWPVDALQNCLVCVQSVQPRPPVPHCVSVSLLMHLVP